MSFERWFKLIPFVTRSQITVAALLPVLAKLGVFGPVDLFCAWEAVHGKNQELN